MSCVDRRFSLLDWRRALKPEPGFLVCLLLTACIEYQPDFELSIQPLLKAGHFVSGEYVNEQMGIRIPSPGGYERITPGELHDYYSSMEQSDAVSLLERGTLFASWSELSRGAVRAVLQIDYAGKTDVQIDRFFADVRSSYTRTFRRNGLRIEFQKPEVVMLDDGIRYTQANIREIGGDTSTLRIYVIPRDGYFVSVEVGALASRAPDVFDEFERRLVVYDSDQDQ